jgi:hypothetical protein
MKSKFFLLAILSLFAVASCHDHGDENDKDAPVLTIEKPAENAVVTGEVRIQGKVTDQSLHKLVIIVTKDSDGSQLFKATPTVHDETAYNYNESFTPSGLTVETAVTLTITVEDHSDNVTTKTVKFKVKS